MKATMDNPGTGWVSISLSFSDEEVERLIHRLRKLKSGKAGHFHFRTDDFGSDEGISDIECSLMGDSDSANMTLE